MAAKRDDGSHGTHPALAVAGVLVGHQEQAIGRHADRLLHVVAVGHVRCRLVRTPPAPASSAPIPRGSDSAGGRLLSGCRTPCTDRGDADTPPVRKVRAPLLPAHQAARHRAAARHHGAGDDPRRGRAAVAGAHRPGARRRRARRRWRQHHQLLDRARPRPGHAAHRATARSRASRCQPEGALVFGLVLEVAAFALLWGTVNLLSAVLAVSAMLFYVFVYTIWLKPRSPQNIVIGGAAGAVPVLVGWAAVTGELAAPAWILFAIVFFWTPPHFWALSLRYRDDYEAAGIPMLPVAKGVDVAAPPDRRVLAWSWSRRPWCSRSSTDTRCDLPGVGHRCSGSCSSGRRCSWSRHSTPERAIRFFTLLEHLPRAAVRRHCRRHPRPLHLTSARRRRDAARLVVALSRSLVVAVIVVVTWWWSPATTTRPRASAPHEVLGGGSAVVGERRARLRARGARRRHRAPLRLPG